jgi:cytoskeleton protein RodZ
MLQIGETLRDARERRGLALSNCEAATRIRARYLAAMEDERFDALPDPAYVRSFLRTYARFLDVDADLLLEEYDSRAAPEPAPGPLDRGRRPPLGRSLGHTAAASLRRRLIEPRPPRAERPPRRLPWLALGGLVAVGLLVWAGRDGERPALERAVPADRSPPAATITQTAPAAPAAPASPAVRAPGVRLTSAGGGSWVQARRGGPQGPVLYEGTLAAGTARSFPLGHPIWLRIGWTPSLAVTVGGRPAALPAGTGNFLVTSEGVRALPG